jgi:hypothetical protein
MFSLWRALWRPTAPASRTKSRQTAEESCNSVTVMWGKMVSLLYNKEKASNAFFSTNVNKSVYFFVYGFRLTFAVFMDGDLPNNAVKRQRNLGLGLEVPFKDSDLLYV